MMDGNGASREESHDNVSNPGRVEPLWGDGRNPDPSRICTARRTNGEPCRKVAIIGANVCATHGGSAPQVKRAARARLENAADRMAKELLRMAADDDVADSVKLAAIRDALDRAGVSAKTAVEVEIGPTKKFEDMLDGIMFGGSRAESRAARGIPDEPLDAEVVEELTALAEPAPTAPAPAPAPPRPQPEQQPRSQGRKTGLMSMEAAMAELNRTAPRTGTTKRKR